MKTTTTLIAAAAALLCGGCRSDGGFGRKDDASDFQFTCRALRRQTADDADATWNTVRSAPKAIGRAFANAGRELSETYRLYLQDQPHGPR